MRFRQVRFNSFDLTIHGVFIHHAALIARVLTVGYTVDLTIVNTRGLTSVIAVDIKVTDGGRWFKSNSERSDSVVRLAPVNAEMPVQIRPERCSLSR